MATKYDLVTQNNDVSAPDAAHVPDKSLAETNALLNEASDILSVSDSGNYSSSSETDCDVLHMCKERQALLLALQDARKLRNELERLQKSEEWHKKEMRQQKCNRLEALERLYAQERKYLQQNQRLQRECMRLYTKCSALEQQLECQDNSIVRNDDAAAIGKTDAVKACMELPNINQNDQHQIQYQDQHELIELLRKQKTDLLEDLNTLTLEKENKVMDLQRTLANMEVENTRITSKCKQLIDERQNLNDALKVKDIHLEELRGDKVRLLQNMECLRIEFYEQQQFLHSKEMEIERLQAQFNDRFRQEDNLEEIHRISMSFHKEINLKSLEIMSLKNSLLQLQTEMSSMKDLQAQNEEQQRIIENLNFSLEEQKKELDEMHTNDARKQTQLAEMQEDMQLFKTEREQSVQQLSQAQKQQAFLEQQLIDLNCQYASMCALCERTKFELEMKEIEQAKLSFQAEGDRKESETLRNKLKHYLKQTNQLSENIKQLESDVEASEQEKFALLDKCRLAEEQVTAVRQCSNSFEDMKEINELGQQLMHNISEVDNILRVNKQVVQEMEVIVSKQPTPTAEVASQCLGLQELKQKLTMLLQNVQLLSEENQELKLQITDSAAVQQAKQQIEKLLKDKQHENLLLINNLEENHKAKQELLLKFIRCDGNLYKIKKQLKNYKYASESSERDVQKLLHENGEFKQRLLEVNHRFSEMSEDLLRRNAAFEKLQAQINAIKLRQSKDAQISKTKHIFNNNSCSCNFNTRSNAKEALMQTDSNLIIEQATQTDLNEAEMPRCDLKSNCLPRRNAIYNSFVPNETAVAPAVVQKGIIVKTQPLNDVLSDNNELFQLREQVIELQSQLQRALSNADHKRNQRIKLIQDLLQENTARTQKLLQSQSDWEEMLLALQLAQKQEQETRQELNLKNSELEELNALFAEQNVLFEELQIYSQQLDLSQYEQLMTSFQQQFDEMKNNYEIKLAQSQQINQQQLKQIEDLTQKNSRLENGFNDDLVSEMAAQKNQIRQLQRQISKLMEEKQKYEEKLQEMDMLALNEFCSNQTNREFNKRNALLIPDFVIVKRDTLDKEVQQPDNVSHNDSKCSVTPDHLRILHKVLEYEHQRKLERYDEYISTLLSNVSSLKKSLRSTQKQYEQMCKENNELPHMLEGQIESMKKEFSQVQAKYEQSLETISAMEQLYAEKCQKCKCQIKRSEQYNADDFNDEPEVSNLIDDYKKLIQESVRVTGRLKTSAILDLIQRSNQCVPNLNKLEKNIDRLSNNIQQFSEMEILSGENAGVPSLMDELETAMGNF